MPANLCFRLEGQNPLQIVIGLSTTASFHNVHPRPDFQWGQAPLDVHCAYMCSTGGLGWKAITGGLAPACFLFLTRRQSASKALPASTIS